MSDPFERWGLSDSASEQEIKRTYKKRVQKMHPDRAGNSPEVLAAFLQLQEDYSLLKDPQQRRLLIQARLEPKQSHTPFSAPLDNMEIADVFAQTQTIPASDLKVHVSVPLSVIWGGGKIEEVVEIGEPCGCGRSALCPYCKGSGQVFVKKRVRIKIPAGTLPGQFLTIPKQGHKGSVSQGDLIVIVKWSQTYGWKWNGQTIERELTIPRWMFKEGKNIAIQSPTGTWGRIQLSKISSSKNYAVIHIPNLGLPEKNSEKRTTAIVVVHQAPLFVPWKGYLGQMRHA